MARGARIEMLDEGGPPLMLSLRYLEETRERVQVVEVVDPDGTVVGNLPVTEVVVRSLAADVATLTVTMVVAEAAVEAMHFRKRTPDA